MSAEQPEHSAPFCPYCKCWQGFGDQAYAPFHCATCGKLLPEAPSVQMRADLTDPEAAKATLAQVVVALANVVALAKMSDSRNRLLAELDEIRDAVLDPNAERFLTQTDRTRGGEIASLLRQAARDRAELVEVRKRCEELRLENEGLRGGPVQKKEPKPYAGRKAGDRCFCGRDGKLFSVVKLLPVRTRCLMCSACDAAYREDGAQWCPKCAKWIEGAWSPGTDADPRPSCPKCGALQPGWGPS